MKTNCLKPDDVVKLVLETRKEKGFKDLRP